MAKKKKTAPVAEEVKDDGYIEYRVKRHTFGSEEKMPGYSIDPNGFKGAPSKKKPIWLKILLGVLITLGICAVLVALVAILMPPIEQMVIIGSNAQIDSVTIKTEDEGYKPTDWMLAVDDETKLNHITIPGTNNSASQYTFLSIFGKCQAYSIAEQLNMGYRYLDVDLGVKTFSNGAQHLVVKNDDLICTEKIWFWSEPVYLVNVISDCNRFLYEHPTETIILHVNYAGGDETISEIQRLLDNVVLAYNDLWLFADKEMPTLAQARGKIVLLRGYSDEAGIGERAGLMVAWDEQTVSADTSTPYVTESNRENDLTVMVEDYTKLNDTDKWEVFMSSLNTLAVSAKTGMIAKGGADGENRVAILSLSSEGEKKYGHPYFHASQLNEKLTKLEFTNGYDYGWVLVDFGTKDMARHIYSLNFHMGE